ncbi:uncharacterized protein [Littorina saxatilis]|uniref:EGF-like domain-containing protein n=1 Tax=Littorina saxatilis TaxID=31220 RepID=A0AAN9AT86_9CAEN
MFWNSRILAIICLMASGLTVVYAVQGSTQKPVQAHFTIFEDDITSTFTHNADEKRDVTEAATATHDVKLDHPNVTQAKPNAATVLTQNLLTSALQTARQKENATKATTTAKRTSPAVRGFTGEHGKTDPTTDTDANDSSTTSRHPKPNEIGTWTTSSVTVLSVTPGAPKQPGEKTGISTLSIGSTSVSANTAETETTKDVDAATSDSSITAGISNAVNIQTTADDVMFVSPTTLGIQDTRDVETTTKYVTFVSPTTLEIQNTRDARTKNDDVTLISPGTTEIPHSDYVVTTANDEVSSVSHTTMETKTIRNDVTSATEEKRHNTIGATATARQYTSTTNRASSTSEACTPGFHSDSGTEPCESCPQGTYQSWDGAMTCDPCPGVTWTKGRNSTSPNDCIPTDILLTSKDILTVAKPNGWRMLTVAGWFYIYPGSRVTIQVNRLGGMSSMVSIAVADHATPLSSARDTVEDNSFHDAARHTINGVFTIEHTSWFMLIFEEESDTFYLTRDEYGKYVVRYVYFSLSSYTRATSLTFTPHGNVKIHGLSYMTESPGLRAFIDNFRFKETCAVKTSGDSSFVRVPSHFLVMPSQCDPGDECATNPCNGHPCNNHPGYFTCNCSKGWTGDLCQTPPAGCFGNSCTRTTPKTGVACEPGKEVRGSSCVPCAVGWWNSGNGTQRFEPCTPCPHGYVTATEGASHLQNCSIRDCPAGDFIDGQRGELCSPCAVDSYQNKARQDHCRPCSPGTHTKTAGSSSLSDCIAPPGVKNTASMNLKYALVVACSSKGVKSVELSLRGRVLGLISEWPDICSDRSCSNAQVSASCAGHNSKAVIAVVKLDKLPVTLTSISTGTTMTAKDMLLTSAVQNDVFQLPESRGAKLEKDDIDVTVEIACAVGFQKIGDTCDCGEGTFRNTSNNSVQCEVCPAGSYQDRPGKYSCNPCPAGTFTSATGADQQSDCTVTGTNVPDTSSSGPKVSATLIGSIVGGFLGLLAILLVVITVCKIFRNGGPMKRIPITCVYDEEHPYTGLTPVRGARGYGDNEAFPLRQHRGGQISFIHPEFPPRPSKEEEELYDYIADNVPNNEPIRYVITPTPTVRESGSNDLNNEGGDYLLASLPREETAAKVLLDITSATLEVPREKSRSLTREDHISDYSQPVDAYKRVNPNASSTSRKAADMRRSDYLEPYNTYKRPPVPRPASVERKKEANPGPPTPRRQSYPSLKKDAKSSAVGADPGGSNNCLHSPTPDSDENGMAEYVQLDPLKLPVKRSLPKGKDGYIKMNPNPKSPAADKNSLETDAAFGSLDNPSHVKRDDVNDTVGGSLEYSRPAHLTDDNEDYQAPEQTHRTFIYDTPVKYAVTDDSRVSSVGNYEPSFTNPEDSVSPASPASEVVYSVPRKNDISDAFHDSSGITNPASVTEDDEDYIKALPIDDEVFYAKHGSNDDKIAYRGSFGKTSPVHGNEDDGVYQTPAPTYGTIVRVRPGSKYAADVFEGSSDKINPAHVEGEDGVYQTPAPTYSMIVRTRPGSKYTADAFQGSSGKINPAYITEDDHGYLKPASIRGKIMYGTLTENEDVTYAAVRDSNPDDFEEDDGDYIIPEPPPAEVTVRATPVTHYIKNGPRLSRNFRRSKHEDKRVEDGPAYLQTTDL